jgi:hypothetical protein
VSVITSMLCATIFIHVGAASGPDRTAWKFGPATHLTIT